MPLWQALRNRICLMPDAFHGAFDAVAAPEIDRWGARGANAGGRARGEHVTGLERDRGADEGDQERDIKNQVGRVSVL